MLLGGNSFEQLVFPRAEERLAIVRPDLHPFQSEQPANRFAEDRLGIDDDAGHVEQYSLPWHAEQRITHVDSRLRNTRHALLFHHYFLGTDAPDW